jgi:hypothetical protein
MREPDFFLVGAPKCGTTALYEMIGAHPEVFVSPVKEPDFFAADVVAAVPALGGRAVTEWSAYLELFQQAGAALAVGEGSVSYLSSAVAAGGIHARCPAARILMVLRNPAERLFSHYTAAVAAGTTRAGFSDWLVAAVKQEAVQSAPIGPVTPGRYGSHVHRYRTHFPESRIHIVWHEEFVSDPGAALRGIFRHLNVDPDCPVPTNLRRNETRRPQVWFRHPMAPRMTTDERAEAIAVYASDLAELGSLTGRDLSRWLDASG